MKFNLQEKKSPLLRSACHTPSDVMYSAVTRNVMWCENEG